MKKMIKLRKTGELYEYTVELAKRRDIDIVEIEEVSKEVEVNGQKTGEVVKETIERVVPQEESQAEPPADTARKAKAPPAKVTVEEV